MSLYVVDGYFCLICNLNTFYKSNKKKNILIDEYDLDS